MAGSGTITFPSNSLEGTSGPDTLLDANFIEGRDGDDYIVGTDRTYFVGGGESGDCRRAYGGELTGGGGNDIIFGGGKADFITGDYGYGPKFDAGVAGFDQIHAGGGDDYIVDMSSDGFAEQVYGGGGRDEFGFLGWYSGAAVDVVADFNPTPVQRSPITSDGVYAGDSLDIVSLLNHSDRPYNEFSTELNNAVDVYDPWAAGYVRLGQLGRDTVLQFDRDGAAGPAGWETVVLLKNVVAAGLSAANFSIYNPPHDYSAFSDGGGYRPVVVTLPVYGTEEADNLAGTKLGDIIDGLGGADRIAGGNGDDNLTGGMGNDTLNGGDGADVLQGGDDSDVLNGGGGADTLKGGIGDDFLRGGSGIDRFEFTAGAGHDTVSDYANGETLSFDASFFGAASELHSLAEFKNMVDAHSEIKIHLDSGNVEVTFGSGDSITIQGYVGDWLHA